MAQAQVRPIENGSHLTPPPSASFETFPKDYATSSTSDNSSSCRTEDHRNSLPLLQTSPPQKNEGQCNLHDQNREPQFSKSSSCTAAPTVQAQVSKKDAPLWYKEFGYKAFTQLIANEQTFFMVRRFGALNARVALSLQDKIVQLEDQLKQLDNINAHPVTGDVNNGTIREEHEPRRTTLIETQLLPKLTEYNNFINSYAQLVNRPAVDKKAKAELGSWLDKHPKTIQDEEAAYIDLDDDLVAVHPKDKSWFRRILELCFVSELSYFRRQPKGYEFNDKEEYGPVHFSNDDPLEKCSAVIIAIIGLAMLVGPLWILDTVSSTEAQLGVITGFIALFFVLVAVATNAKIFESLAAAAAYSAVLMVFLQMGANRGK